MDNYFDRMILMIGTFVLFHAGPVCGDSCHVGAFEYRSCAYCCGTGSSQYCCDYDDKYPTFSLNGGIIAALVVGVIIFIFFVIFIVVCCCIARKRSGFTHGTVMRTTQVTGTYPYNTNNQAGNMGPSVTAGVVPPPVVTSGYTNQPYPVGPNQPPPPSTNYYPPAQPHTAYVPPSNGMNNTTAASTEAYSSPPSYEQITAMQASQMKTPATVPVYPPDAGLTRGGYSSSGQGMGDTGGFSSGGGVGDFGGGGGGFSSSGGRGGDAGGGGGNSGGGGGDF